MIDERAIVQAILQDRTAYDALAGRLDPADFGAQAALVVKNASQFYQKDSSATRVDLEVLRSQVTRTFANKKHAESVLAWLGDLPEAVSSVNVAAEYRQMRRHKIGLELASKLGSGEHSDATERLVEKYRLFGVDTGEAEKPKLTIDELVETVGEGKRIRLVPAALNKETAGGVLRGHNIVIYGRPESGKSMMAINLSAGFCNQNLRTMYAANEEPISDVQKRHLSRMSGIPISRIQESRADLELAVERAKARGYDNLYAQELRTGRVAEVEALIRKYKPDVLIVDQIKNLHIPGVGNQAQELDAIARELRRMAKQYQMVLGMVTQAGDSAEQKLKLGMSDIEGSKTGIPGAADLMIGVGVSDAYAAQNRRMISLPKNKLSGKHSFFTLYVEPQFSLYRSAPREAA
jgi:archaellum biogenesis ATPase FlaH